MVLVSVEILLRHVKVRRAWATILIESLCGIQMRRKQRVWRWRVIVGMVVCHPVAGHASGWVWVHACMMLSRIWEREAWGGKRGGMEEKACRDRSHAATDASFSCSRWESPVSKKPLIWRYVAERRLCCAASAGLMMSSWAIKSIMVWILQDSNQRLYSFKSFVFPKHGLHWGLTRSFAISSLHPLLNYCETRLWIIIWLWHMAAIFRSVNKLRCASHHSSVGLNPIGSDPRRKLEFVQVGIEYHRPANPDLSEARWQHGYWDRVRRQGTWNW